MWPFKEKRATTIENPGVPISAANIMSILNWDTQTVSGINVTPDEALKVPAVWSAVNFIANTIATLPLNVYQKNGEDREKLSSDPVHRMLHDSPNPEWTSFAWRKYKMTQTLNRGRSYTYIERAANGKISSLWPLDHCRVHPEKSGFRTIYRYAQPGGRWIEYTSDQIIDIPYMLDTDQVTCINPTTRLRGTIGLSIVLENYAQRFFQNGGVPPLALEGPFQSPGAVKRASAEISQAIKDAASSKSPVLSIPDGHKLNALGFNPEQGQMLEARRFMLEEVARIYNLSPIFLQDLTHGTFSNTEQQDLHVVKHTLSHWVKQIEQEMNLKLFRNSSRYCEFNMDGLLRGDFRARMEGYAKGIQNAILAPNEARAKENMARKDGADDLFIQQNMISPTRLGGSDGD